MIEVLREHVLAIVARHRRHVEQSPGVGVERQTYALDVLDDVQREMESLPDAVNFVGGPPAERPPEQRTYADGYRDAQHDRDELEKEQRRLRLREKIIADPDVDTDAGILHPEAGVAERRDPLELSEKAIETVHRIMRNDLGPIAREYVAELLQTYEALRATDRRGTGAEPTGREQEIRQQVANARSLDLKVTPPWWHIGDVECLLGEIDRLRGALRAGGSPEEEASDG